MELRGFFATVFVFLLAEEVYSLSLIYDGYDGYDCERNNENRCNCDGRYVRINMKKCENINSRNKCKATADAETSSNSNTNFRLEKKGQKRCISFNNIYSLTVERDNTVSFQNVSCQNGKDTVWLTMRFSPRSKHKRHRMFFYEKNGTMCLTRGCTGTLYMTPVNSTDDIDRKCFFSGLER